MKKLAIFTGLLFLLGQGLMGQSAYRLSFNFPNLTDSVSYQAFLLQNETGNGVLRLKFISPKTGDNVLLEANSSEEIGQAAMDCVNKDRIYYKLGDIKFVRGQDSTIVLPKYLVFTLDTTSGLFEPYGVSSSSDECKTPVAVFSQVNFLEQKDLTNEFVLSYFTKQETFYRNLFETRTRALTVSERNVNLILIVVANSHDEVIGESCVKDMNRMVATFRSITDFLGIRFSPQTITGSNYNKGIVEKAINGLNPSGNDIVVFYYSGHGFRKPRDSRRAPYIDLREKNDNTVMQNSLNMEDVFNRVKSKGARLNLVLADCCNALIESRNGTGNAPAGKKGFSMNWSAQNVRDLFLNVRPTSILATAAEPGQLATSNNRFGGFFSYYFKTSVENHFSYFKSNVTWSQVFAEAKKQTRWKADHTYCALPDNPRNICNQTPYINIR